MPRTPAPLTVEYNGAYDGWNVLATEGYSHGGKLVATFFKEADARAFVALPQLIEAMKVAEKELLEYLGDCLDDDCDCGLFKVRAALALVDGPSPKEP